MTTNDTTSLVNRIYGSVQQRHLLEALNQLAALAEQCGGSEDIARLEQIKTSYSYLLSYFAAGADDKDRNMILSDLISAILHLTDSCSLKLHAKAADGLFYIRHASLSLQQLTAQANDYAVASKKLEILTSVDESLQNRRAVDDTRLQIERAETEIFNCIWAIWPTLPEEADVIDQLFCNENAPKHMQCLIASALFLGCLSVFDEQKLVLLLKIYKASSSAEIRSRCIVGFLLASYRHQLHVKHSRHIALLVEDLSESEAFRKDIFTAWKRLVMSRNTENIKKRLNNDIISTINKIMPQSFKKSFGKNNVIDMADIQANPEWQEAFEKSGLNKKIEEFNEIQMSGGDVFLPTFSKLKSFPFFQTMSNWFVPFHKDQSAVHSLLQNGSKSFEQMIVDAPLMCNSDKYSLVLSFEHIPQEFREKMLYELDSQKSAMPGSTLSEADGDAAADRCANAYVQDLYRFFKLFSRRKEFYAIFDTDLALDEIPFVGQLLKTPKHIEFVADYYLNNMFYSDAAKYYRMLLAESSAVNPMVYQKLGLAYQNSGDFASALAQYQHYELADDTNLWNIRHIAVCYRSLHQPDKALAYYQKADNAAPGRLPTYLSIGHCLLELNRNTEGLEYFFKAELADDKHTHKAWRPIAWTAFLCGQYEQSEKYYNRILADEDCSPQDLMNHGHLMYAMHRVQDAIASYAKALHAMGNEEAFFKAFESDLPVLQSKSAQSTDVQLLHDAIKFKSN